MSSLRNLLRSVVVALGLFCLIAGAVLVAAPRAADAVEPLPLADEPIETVVVEVGDAKDGLSWVGPEQAHLHETQRLASEARSAMSDAQRALTRHDQGRATEHVARALDLMAELSWHAQESRGSLSND